MDNHQSQMVDRVHTLPPSSEKMNVWGIRGSALGDTEQRRRKPSGVEGMVCRSYYYALRNPKAENTEEDGCPVSSGESEKTTGISEESRAGKQPYCTSLVSQAQRLLHTQATRSLSGDGSLCGAYCVTSGSMLNSTLQL